MPSIRALFRLKAVVIALSLTACEGGIEGTGINDGSPQYASQGTVTGFGSVYVNGVEYDTKHSTVLINNKNATEAQLGLGMVVTVKGAVNANGKTGRANQIVYDQNVKGPITTMKSIDTNMKTITVLGQTVEVSEETVFEGVTMDALTEGAVIEASGLITPNNTLSATRLEQVQSIYDGTATIEVEGRIGALNDATQQFNIRTQTIDYSNATLNLQGNTLHNGMEIEVVGSTITDTNTLVADTVNTKNNEEFFQDSAMLDIEGIINGYQSPSNFYINGMLIDASNARLIRGDMNQLGDGVRVTVKGDFNIDDQGNPGIEADKVRFHLISDHALTAPITNLSSEQQSLTVLGLDVQTTEATTYSDKLPQSDRFFHFSDLHVGDWLTVRGSLFQGSFIATQLQRFNPTMDTVSVAGVITSIDANERIHVLNIMVDLANVKSGAKWVGNLAVGDKIEVTGAFTSDNYLQADSIKPDK